MNKSLHKCLQYKKSTEIFAPVYKKGFLSIFHEYLENSEVLY